MPIAYLATADARGHLMRAQLLTHALQARGMPVRLITTSDDGQRFLAGFGLPSELLSRHYAVQFDGQQNMLREATDANVARYVFHPARMARDILRLRRVLSDHDLILNDSFHPALLVMGCLPRWRHKVVHIYGASLRNALQGNFAGRLPGWLAGLFGHLIALQIASARARLEHDFAYPERAERHGRSLRLPTPVAVVPASACRAAQAAVYLNPHFRDPALASALEQGLDAAGLSAHRVGEGFADRPGWLAQDTQWVHQAAASALIVSAPGMAALAVARVYRIPIVLLVTDQPEQLQNAARAAELGLQHRTVVWRGDGPACAAAIQAACEALRTPGLPDASSAQRAPAHASAAARLQIWVDTLLALAPNQGANLGITDRLVR